MTDPLAIYLESLERELLTPAARHDAARLEALLSPDFREFGASGRAFDREAIIADLTAEPPIPHALSLSHFTCQPLSERVALVTYRTERATPNGPSRSLRSSLWAEQEGQWQIHFHQGTPIPLRPM